MRHIKVKICGITTVQDAVAACEMGADYIGLIFVPGTPRYIEPTAAEKIVDAVGGRCRIVGVFQNASAGEIEAAKGLLGFEVAQLHGDESASLAHSLQPFIKAITLSTKDDLRRASDYSSAEAVIFDRPKSSPSPNWLAEALVSLSSFESATPFMLAGGINADNVRLVCESLASNTSFAGIDVASGIEKSPGIKDKNKMQTLIETAREVSNHAFAR